MADARNQMARAMPDSLGPRASKQVARDMIAMNARLNRELLASIPNLRGPNPVVNCTTCHRGQVKPALNLGEASPR